MRTLAVFIATLVLGCSHDRGDPAPIPPVAPAELTTPAGAEAGQGDELDGFGEGDDEAFEDQGGFGAPPAGADSVQAEPSDEPSDEPPDDGGEEQDLDAPPKEEPEPAQGKSKKPVKGKETKPPAGSKSGKGDADPKKKNPPPPSGA